MNMTDSKHMENQLEKTDVIRLVQGLHQIHKRTISASYYQKLCLYLDYPSIDNIITLFGSWSNLLETSGIVNNLSIPDRNRLNRLSNDGKIKKLSASESLQLYASLHGRHFTMREYTEFRNTRPELLSCNSIINQYKGWNKALSEHGFVSRGRYSKEECLKALHQASLEITNPLTTSKYIEWSSTNSGPSLSTIFKYFESWNQAITILSKQKN